MKKTAIDKMQSDVEKFLKMPAWVRRLLLEAGHAMNPTAPVNLNQGGEAASALLAHYMRKAGMAKATLTMNDCDVTLIMDK